MEHDSVLPHLSANYPWLVVQNLNKAEAEAEDHTRVQNFYTLHNNSLHYHYHCRIPELTGRRFCGSYHGWMILSDHPHNVKWSLWNPVTSKFIRLPPLIHKNGEFYDIKYTCLSSPPEDPTSVLLLMTEEKPNIIFCKLDPKRKRSKWIEMSYSKQLNTVMGENGILHFPTCSNGRVYALGLAAPCMVLQLDIVVNDSEVLITLLPIRETPIPSYINFPSLYWLKGSSTELFFIIGNFSKVSMKTLDYLHLFKLDMTSSVPTWEEIQDLKDAVFFVDFSPDVDFYVFYSSPVASEVGGYVHIRCLSGNKIYSYHVKDKTVSILHASCLAPGNHVSLWECSRLEGDQGEVKCTIDYKQEEVKDDEIERRSITNDEANILNESHLLNIPFHVLEMMMEFCVGIGYMYFRATCKRCYLATPLEQWRTNVELRKILTYSLDSPWLMVVQGNQGIMNFTDPIFGDKYYTKTLPVYIRNNDIICCSRFGWLLFYSNMEYLVFFNPFTRDVRKLPTTPFLIENVCFSAPPTSPSCMVVGFTSDGGVHAYILNFLDSEPFWHRFNLDYGSDVPDAFCFPTFSGRDLYALCDRGELVAFKEISAESFSRGVVVAKSPTRHSNYFIQYFLVEGGQHLFLVTVEEFGHMLEVFKLDDITKEWKKIDSLGKHMIYICGSTCLYIKAETPQMQNKIFFPRLHFSNQNIVFYSLETCKYHTFDGKNIGETYNSLFGTKYYLCSHAWIEPNW